jgi:hypothetical protein
MSKAQYEMDRREFIAGVGAGMAATKLMMASVAAIAAQNPQTPYKPTPPLPLKVQPVLAVKVFKRKKQASWRMWGGLHSQEDIEQEKQRIQRELNNLSKKFKSPLEILPLITLNDCQQAANVAKGNHDVMLIYAANTHRDVVNSLTNPEKWNLIFLRHKSGPVYLWYEVVHVWYLRQNKDEFSQPGIDHQDIVVDDTDELLWRLRALYGLKNTIGKKIVALGGAGGWGGHKQTAQATKDIWKMDIQEISYPMLEDMIKKANQNKNLVERCYRQADQYVKQWGVRLKTDKKFVERAFVLTEVFKTMLYQAKTNAFTIKQCMTTVMPISETTACIPLTILNDTGYTAYCESDFVVIPAGILLHYISGLPIFLNDPTYPHNNVVTLAHCTAPRKMNGKDHEPATILTHFESDYGAAPKVDMKVSQKITVIDPDFASKRWLGFEGKIIANPSLDICRSQIDVKINGNCDTLNAETKGFHWIASYNNYLKEMGYAAKKVGIDWLNLSESTTSG